MHLIYALWLFVPPVICIASLIVTQKLTKGRCGQDEYAIAIVIVIALQVAVSYYPLFLGLGRGFLSPFILLLLFCINIHASTKRFNDAITEEYDKTLIYCSPVANLVLVMANYMSLVLLSDVAMKEPRIVYLALLVLANALPAYALYSRASDISIKEGDIPVNYIQLFSDLYLNEIANVIVIGSDHMCINNSEYSIDHYQNKHTITSHKNNNDTILENYFKEKNINKLGLHYVKTYFELTDNEYSVMINDMRGFKNVIYIHHPFVVINGVNVFIRKYGTRYCMVLLKSDRETLNYEINVLKNIATETENEEYVCYRGIKKNDIIEWVKDRI